MNDTHPRQSDQAWRHRRDFAKHWDHHAHVEMGVPRPQVDIVYRLVTKSLNKSPFEWTAQWSQREWAARWNFEYETFRRHLRQLLQTRILLREGHRKGAVYTVNPRVVQAFVTGQIDQIRALRQLVTETSSTGHRDQFGSEASGSPNEYSNPPDPSDGGDPQVSGNPLGAGQHGHRHSNRSEEDPVGLVLLEAGDGSAVASEETMRRRQYDEDPPVVYGADPDRKPTEGDRRGSRKPSVQVLDTFQREWDAARQRYGLPAEYPHRVDGGVEGRKRFFAWVNNTYLPSLPEENRLEIACEIVRHFCGLVARGQSGFAYKPGSRWTLTVHFDRRWERAYASLKATGWVPEAERRAKEARREQRRAEDAAAAEAARERQAQAKAAEDAAIEGMVVAHDARDIELRYPDLAELPTEDLQDWVDVPLDERETEEQFVERLKRQARRKLPRP